MALDSLERLISRLVSRKGFAGRKHNLLFSKGFKYGVIVQQGELFWTNGSVAPNYTYPEQTP
jgi:hypothetical protein